ncbi:MAG: hypothetical protein JNK56_25955, partial [Myxococcales bacterium]|nr:hypothetical protein [Myxococcales bacterium]
DAPVWAVIAGAAVQVFGGEQARTIELGDAIYSGWRLGSDGRTLVATTQAAATTSAWAGSVHLWDLTRPEAPPRVIELAPETLPVIADDAAIVLAQAARGIRVIRAREGGEQLIKYRGTPWALSADGRFVVARPAGRDGVMDVLEIATGRARRVEADAVKLLGGDDVLFTRMGQGRPFVRREALASGAVAWQLPLPGQAGSQDSRLVVDAAHEQFAVAVGEVWGVGDLRRGELSAFVTVPKDRSPRWVGPGALAVVVEHEVRIHRPVDSPVQVRYAGSGCGLAPGGGFAVVQPHDVVAGAYTRVALGTGATATFRCPQPPRTRALGGQFAAHDVSAVVDDAGQVAMLGGEGWSCWWDEQHGARAGARGLGHGLLVGLPRGVALADGAEVEVWAGPEQRVQRFTAAAPVLELEANASGGLLAVRSEGGVEVLHVDSGAVMPVRTFRAPTGRAEVLASALAWSPDGTQLAVLDKIGASLELSVWDVVGEPREVSPPDHVMLGGHVLEDSPGRPRNRMAFTPGGGAVVVTDRRESLLRVDLATHQLWRVDAPELLELHMRGESELVGVDVRNVPVTVDLATGEVSPLTANLEAGGSTRPQLRGGADGAVWSCAALGPGTLIEVAAVGDSSAPALRARVLDLAAAM